MSTKVEHQEQWPNLRSVEEMYEGDFLIKCGLFEGGFINFGYWKEFSPAQVLTIEDRVESAENLYRYILNKMKVSKRDRLLEVGCGTGMGSSLALHEFEPRAIRGIDASSSQIARTKQLNPAPNNRLSFQVGMAEKIPYRKNTFDKVFSIEAAQHFKSLPAFIEEVHRVLKPNGILALATFFAVQDEPSKEALEMIPTVRDKVDYLHPISKVRMLIEEGGFKEVKIESLGENVWQGFDAWIAQGEFKDSWDRNWYKGYKEGFFDYYLLLAKKIL